MLRALDESDPRMVAARMAQGIAVAVSTSRSYAAFVAAVTAAESSALLLVEDKRDHSPPHRCGVRQRNALKAAAEAAIAADAGIMSIGAWPFSTDPCHRPTGVPVAESVPFGGLKVVTNMSHTIHVSVAVLLAGFGCVLLIMLQYFLVPASILILMGDLLDGHNLIPGTI
jgi:hypothetical protein